MAGATINATYEIEVDGLEITMKALCAKYEAEFPHVVDLAISKISRSEQGDVQLLNHVHTAA